MDEQYISLFSELIHTNEILAEQVMEFNHQKNDDNGERTAQLMRDDYRELFDKIQANPLTLSKNDYAKLLVGSLVILNNILEKIKSYQIAAQGYKSDVIPKLKRIVDECATDEEAQKLSLELFKSKVE